MAPAQFFLGRKIERGKTFAPLNPNFLDMYPNSLDVQVRVWQSMQFIDSWVVIFVKTFLWIRGAMTESTRFCETILRLHSLL